MWTNVVEVRDRSRQFGATRALEGVSLKIEPGLVYGLVGAVAHRPELLLLDVPSTGLDAVVVMLGCAMLLVPLTCTVAAPLALAAHRHE